MSVNESAISPGSGWMSTVLLANPMHAVITGYRDVLVYGEFRQPEHVLVGFAWGVGLFVLGFRVFAWVEPKFAERV